MTPSLTELILDRAHNAVVSMDEQGLVTYWNPSAERMFGIARPDAIGHAVADLIVPPRLRAQHQAGLRRFLETEESQIIDRRVELDALRPDGTEFPIELTISAVRENDAWSFHAFIQDVSERRQSEQEHQRLVEELRRALEHSQMRFDAIVGSLDDPVTIRDRNDHLLYANRAALEYLGYESWDDLRNASMRDVMAEYVVTREDGSPVQMDDIPSVRILRGEPAEPLLIRTVHRHTGRERWNLLKSAPLSDRGGTVQSTIMIIEDVTEHKQAERQATFLAQAGEVLASSLDYEQTLRNVARLAVPDIADWCAVDLCDEDGARKPVAVAHADPKMLRLAEELREYEPMQPNPDEGLGYVFRTGESRIYSQIPAEMIESAAVDERHLELLRTVGLRSAVVVPMKIGTRTLGAMTLVSAESGRTLDRFELQLAEQVAARAAVAIENARLYSERSAIAYTLQESLLPEELPEVPGYELAAAYIPAVESSAVGGDFYDVWNVDGAWMLVIGDVTGKGVEAAALTSLVRHSIRAAAEFESSPAKLLGRADAILKKQRRRSICTALCLRLEQDRIVCAVGGHPLPIYLDETVLATVGAHGPLLGGFPEATWREQAIPIEPGGALVMYTDGVTDAVGADGTRFGIARLHETLAGCRDRAAAEVVRALVSSVDRFQAGTHADDTAALVLRRDSANEASAAQVAADHERTAASPSARITA
jgi:PAS domain S-box-containing protein